MQGKIWTAVMMMMLSCAINPQIRIHEEVDAPNPMQRTAVRPPSTLSSPIIEEDYRIGYGDELEVKFFNNGEYNEIVQVRPDGKISLQRIKDLRVVGMPISRLGDLITQAYADILVNPEVTVFLRSAGGRRVYVMGQVQQPGSYELVRGMSVLRAIAAAGGPINGAKMNSVMLLRRDEQQGLSAERLDLTLNANAGKLAANDLPLQAFDLIYVPKTFIADVDAWVSQVYRIVLTPLDVYSRALYYQRAFNGK